MVVQWGGALGLVKEAPPIKRIETRSWARSIKSLKPGDRLAIHAAKTQVDPDSRERLKDWWIKNVVRGARPFSVFAFKQAGIETWEDFPFGAILGHGVFVGAFPTEKLTVAEHGLDPLEESWGNYSPGRFGWVYWTQMSLSGGTMIAWRAGGFGVSRDAVRP